MTSLIQEYVKEVLIAQQERKILEENALKKAAKWIKEKGSQGKAKIKAFLLALKEELSETKVGIGLLQKMAAGQALSSDEINFLKEQVQDIASGTFLLGLFAIPGGGIATTVLIKIAEKYGISLMPSSFIEEPEL